VADSLASIARDSAAFPEPERDRVRGAVRTYVRAVVDDEWVRMRDGSDSPRATTMTPDVRCASGSSAPE